MKNCDTPSLLSGWNCLPNIVTYIRIILSAVFIGLYIAAGSWGVVSPSLRWVVFVLFVFAASTDKVDGYLARKYHQVTELGKLLDPIADKLLILGALIVASVYDEISWIITALFLIREIGITVLRFYVIHRGGTVMAASSLGKYKTFTQSVGLSMILLPVYATIITDVNNWPTWVIAYYSVAYGLLGIALAFAGLSAYTYTRGAIDALKRVRVRNN